MVSNFSLHHIQSAPLKFASDEAERDKIWEARKGALWASLLLRPNATTQQRVQQASHRHSGDHSCCQVPEAEVAKVSDNQVAVWTTDVAVPISKLAECITATKKDLESSFLIAPIVGHVSDGNFHSLILINPSDQKEVNEARRLNKQMIERAIAMGGTCTGEHGVGVGKKKYLPLELGDSAIDMMRTIKMSLDPHNLMNPGKVFDPKPQQSSPK